MGRKPHKNPNLPPRMRKRPRGKKVWFYYDAGGRPRKEIPLGSDYIAALKKYAELEITTKIDPNTIAKFEDAVTRYSLNVLFTKAPKTQKDNLLQLKKLGEFFKDAPLSQIKPQHVAQYLEWRRAQPIAANREVALFSDIFRYARECGLTDAENPARGVRKHKEKPRDVYVTNEDYLKCWDCASQAIRDAMDLAYYTGQRPADLLKMKESDIREGAIWVQQGKTGKKLRIDMSGDLKTLIDQIRERKQANAICNSSILVTDSGERLTKAMLRNGFMKAKSAAKVAFQFRDIRAKVATDKEEQTGDIGKAQEHLGHTQSSMTIAYIRNRKGKLVEPMQKPFRKAKTD